MLKTVVAIMIAINRLIHPMDAILVVGAVDAPAVIHKLVKLESLIASLQVDVLKTVMMIVLWVVAAYAVAKDANLVHKSHPMIHQLQSIPVHPQLNSSGYV